MNTPRTRPGQFSTGDRVIAACHLGGFLRRRVTRGTPGIVFALIDSTTLCVQFEGGVALDVNAEDVDLAVSSA
jgi:hypothetical protein